MKATSILIILCCLIGSLTQAQVGINVEAPQADLHVNGEVLIQSEFKTAAFDKVSNSEENFQLLTRVQNSDPIGELKVLNTAALNVAPVNIFEYEFTNLSGDNVTDVDLQFDTSKYIVTVSDFRYLGDAIKKQLSGAEPRIGYFVQRPFEQNGTWHIEIKNRVLDPDPGDQVTYKMTLVVYNRDFFKKLPIISTSLNGSNTGTASSAPILN